MAMHVAHVAEASGRSSSFTSFGKLAETLARFKSNAEDKTLNDAIYVSVGYDGLL